MWNLLKSHLDVVGPLRLSGCRGLLRALEGGKVPCGGGSLAQTVLIRTTKWCLPGQVSNHHSKARQDRYLGV